jgi:O-6-methylguanine DNA methyltransferase
MTTYGALAAKIGKPRAARAVGGAMNRNPIPIVLPCHRVVGSNGSLVGYGGGLERKETPPPAGGRAALAAVRGGASLAGPPLPGR